MLLILAFFPVVTLLLFVYYVDKYQPEPWHQIFRAFGFGILSAYVTVVALSAIDMQFEQTLTGAICDAFFNAAIPEEAVKLLMLWFVLRHNRYFDEYFDGVVYAVCVGMGFAAVENVEYLLQADDWVSTGVGRAVFAVPAHFLFAVAMGYYYSLVHFQFHENDEQARQNKIRLLAVPVLFHGLYDASLMVMEQSAFAYPIISLLCVLVFLGTCIYMVVSAVRKFKRLLFIDRQFLEYQQKMREYRMRETTDYDEDNTYAD